MQIAEVKERAEKICDNMEQVIVGKRMQIKYVLAAFLAGGNVLLEDVPGTGKTMLSKSLAASFDMEFGRIQFTPDLLPSDVTGVNFFDPQKNQFEFRKGPVFTNILLGDEINRATPRTQSSLLECMEEHQVTVDGETMPLNEPFFVIATQNPVEMAGTFPLPQAQLDRFMIQLSLGYPEEGFLPVSQYSFAKKKKEENPENEEETDSAALEKILPSLKMGMKLSLHDMKIKEGETSPPKRYNSGSMILAMENAGQLIEDEELRAMIKGSGIGTSATRAEILKKLVNISYLDLNKKTQIITPTLKGELVCGIVRYSIPAMLSPKLTASWEKGLTGVSDGGISENEYMDKLTGFVKNQVGKVKQTNNIAQLRSYYQVATVYYKNKKKGEK